MKCVILILCIFVPHVDNRATISFTTYLHVRLLQPEPNLVVRVGRTEIDGHMMEGGVECINRFQVCLSLLECFHIVMI
jgi:hypothetical protein